MINEATTVVPIWMVLAAAFGFIAGEAFGDCTRHRKDLKQANDELREELGRAGDCKEPLDRELKHQRAVLHDVHRRIVAVSKGLEKRPS
jgi:hypothetical protein